MTSPEQEKPRAEVHRPELTRLVRLSPARRAFRRLVQWVFRLAVWICTKPEVKGLENYPRQGPALLAINHLGDADAFVALSFAPNRPDTLAKVELYDLPLVGWVLHSYGVIWVHRGSPDRKALRAALNALKEGRMVALAPEGRESVTGSLEEGTGGAAFLALQSGAPVIPLAVTGTENGRIFGNLKRLRRTRVSLTVGEPFYLEQLPDRRAALDEGTQLIMTRLARLLPPEYQGVYNVAKEQT